MTILVKLRHLSCALGFLVVLGEVIATPSASAAAPVLTELTVDPLVLEQGRGIQQVAVSVRAFDADEDLKTVKVVARFKDGTKAANVEMLDDGSGGDLIAADGRFTGQLPIDTGTAQRISLMVKAKDAAKNTMKVGAIVSVADTTVAPVISEIIVEPPVLQAQPGVQTVTIAVRIKDPNDDVEKVKLEQLKKPGKPDRLAKLGKFVDDGTGGDILAGDGVWTIQEQFETAETGIIPLRIKVKDAAKNKIDREVDLFIQMSEPPVALVEYPAGAYAMWPVRTPVAPEVLAHPGIVGVFLFGMWADIEIAEDVFDWTTVDARLDELGGVGFKVALAIQGGGRGAPEWLKAQVPTMDLINNAATCEVEAIPVLWDPGYLAEKIEFIQAAGARYAEHPAVVAVTASFAGTFTGDWNLQPQGGFVRACNWDNTAQMLEAGYTTDLMVEVGKQVLDATAAAFPVQHIKNAVGMSPDMPSESPPATRTTLAETITDYGAATYPARYHIQISNLNANMPVASDPAVTGAVRGDFRFLQRMIAEQAPFSGLQMVSKATNGFQDGYRLNGGTPNDDAVAVLENAVGIGLTYAPRFLEFWQADSENPELVEVLEDATARMQGAAP